MEGTGSLKNSSAEAATLKYFLHKYYDLWKNFQIFCNYFSQNYPLKSKTLVSIEKLFLENYPRKSKILGVQSNFILSF